MIAMLHVEYRESRGVDFLVSSRDAYRELRGIVTREGIAGLFVGPVVLLREARMDQYGIRTLIAVDDVPIEFEFEIRRPGSSSGTGGMPAWNWDASIRFRLDPDGSPLDTDAVSRPARLGDHERRSP